MLEKKVLSPEVLEAQTAMELPDREMMALVVINPSGLIDVDVDVGDITVTVQDVNVGANVCANVLASNSDITCTVTQQ